MCMSQGHEILIRDLVTLDLGQKAKPNKNIELDIILETLKIRMTETT